MMRFLTFLTLNLYYFSLFAQLPSDLEIKQTRAVIIGIAEYQDTEIPELHYPVKDAMAFAAFLNSNIGGEVDIGSMRIMLNDQATVGNINSAIDWLIETSEKGDKIVFYFSGYGDLIPGDKQQPFFLIPYDVPHSLLYSQAFAFFKYKKLLVQLAKQKGLELMMIFDSYIMTRFSNIPGPGRAEGKWALDSNSNWSEFMINSSSTKAEISYSKTKDFRKTYSHQLLDGLSGKADENGDLTIQSNELENYLKSNNSGQINAGLYLLSMHMDNQLNVLSEKALNFLNTQSGKYRIPEVRNVSGNIYQDLVDKLNSDSQETFQNFLIAINLGNLLYPKNSSASHYHELLLKDPAINPIRRGLDRMLAAALQDEAQQAINAYLRNDPTEAINREENRKSYKIYSEYLKKAADLLGTHHYIYDRLQAISLYFDGLSQRLDADIRQADTEIYHSILKLQENALAIDADAPFIYNELGLMYSRINDHDNSKKYYEKALELAPSWATPYNNIGVLMTIKRDFKAATEWYDKAIVINPNFSFPYYNMACVLSLSGKKNEALAQLEKAIQLGFLLERQIRTDSDLDALRETEEYKRIMEQYFPN